MLHHTIFYKKIRSKGILFYGFCALCMCVVAINIIFSQKYNKHMYGVMEGDTKSILYYLKHIWGTPLFDLEVETYKEEGRSDVLSEWSNIQLENTKKIQNLEKATLRYPHSPELYKSLYLLYSENGDKTKAEENLKKAQEIDPGITKL